MSNDGPVIDIVQIVDKYTPTLIIKFNEIQIAKKEYDRPREDQLLDTLSNSEEALFNQYAEEISNSDAETEKLLVRVAQLRIRNYQAEQGLYSFQNKQKTIIHQFTKENDEPAKNFNIETEPSLNKEKKAGKQSGSNY